LSGHRPYTLVAELTYRCPLRCSYCSNPIDWAKRKSELDTETWLRVFREAEDLGVVGLNLTGGEPIVRRDLEELIAGARQLDLYVNLITSGIPLSRERLAKFRAAGLDNVQVSVQDVSAKASDRIAGLRSFEKKLEVCGWVKELGMPLTLNVVLHRIAITQIRLGGPGRAYFEHRLAAGDTKTEAIRALRRRISDEVFRRMRLDEAAQAARTADLAVAA